MGKEDTGKEDTDKEADHLLANGVATTGGPAAAQVKRVASCL
jgi:hypothetical protein